ncbi:MAG: lysoplasmalogenase [Desulfatitalea sp.]|nr:lysoplasmalogenase [Desulfatitalea sp.]NNK01735.1 lysoplasmalogenase [Desulfatitalea sp.]
MNYLPIICFSTVALLQVFSVNYQDSEDPKRWKRRVAKITKPALMPALLWLYLSFASLPSSYIIAALCAGWLGDIALMIQPNKKMASTMFMVGLLFFLMGHIFYGICFFSQSATLFNKIPLFALMYLPYLIYCLVLYTYLFAPGVQPTLRIGAILYSIALTTMSFSGLTLLVFSPSTATAILFIGTLIFISSDSVLALKDIGQKKQLPDRYIIGSYIIAQMFIVMGTY